MTGFVIETVLDDAAIAARCHDAFSFAVGVLGDAIRDDCMVYVPYDTGTLCRSVTRGAVLDAEGQIGCDVIWSAPYASAVYYGDSRGVRYKTEHHAHARARWFEGACGTCCDAWLEAVRGAVRMGFGS
ncbi:MAG: hypothetical protein E7604_01640 [Ruminococcaceae bacterium]|nr:hypothetical protein [Oscillospiraceae bacterium]